MPTLAIFPLFPISLIWFIIGILIGSNPPWFIQRLQTIRKAQKRKSKDTSRDSDDDD